MFGRLRIPGKLAGSIKVRSKAKLVPAYVAALHPADPAVGNGAWKEF
jgi:hypothetical protein